MQINKLMLNYVGGIHFSGIGGIGMSGIAEILHNLGYKIQGSDLADNYVTKRLRELGIKIFIGQVEENINNVSLVVKSTAIKDNNQEIIAAHKHKIPVISRTEMLAELLRLKNCVAVAGSHGKTTTTSLTACMFESANMNPTVINGGIINNRNTNAYIGNGDFVIAEADESDATFIKIPSTIGIITNIDPEHMDYYHNFDDLKQAFRTFILNLPFYGFGVLCIDHPIVREIAASITNRKIITYGIDSKDAYVRATNIRQELSGSVFDVIVSDNIKGSIRELKNIKLPTPGLHNVLNALGPIAIALELGFAKDHIINGFNSFDGVKRRFTITGEYNGAKFIDDYAHHPEEIKVTLKTAKSVANLNNGKVIAIFQPHRYSRFQNLFSDFVHCFGESDILYIADVYGAGEEAVADLNKELLLNVINQSKAHSDARLLMSPDDLPEIIKKDAKPNDIVIFLGAGNITYWANDIVNKL
jgi:UDP-N-acetylmuramate--alanine ligase